MTLNISSDSSFFAIMSFETPLEYLCEDFDIDILEEIKDDQGQYWKDYDNRIKMSGDNPTGENDS